MLCNLYIDYTPLLKLTIHLCLANVQGLTYRFCVSSDAMSILVKRDIISSSVKKVTLLVVY